MITLAWTAVVFTSSITLTISHVTGKAWLDVAKNEPALVVVITESYTGVERVGLNEFATSVLDDGL